MTNSQTRDADWLRAWIEQQREHLRRAAPGAPGEAGPDFTQTFTPDFAENFTQDLAGRWVAASLAYVRGLTEFAQSQPGDATSSAARLNEEMLNAWRGGWAGATSSGRDAGQRFLEALGRLPALGIAREHAEAWRELAIAQRECQELEQALRLELTRLQNDVLSLLEQRIGERAQTDKPIGGWRELYDLWVECGEQTYAQLAHSEAYSKLQAELGNAAVRLRARQQKILEHALRQFDLPTRSELNSVHRQLRELRERVAMLEAERSRSST
jgi:class III poly(R)-hydroxyalkanoic acid synthase PhaE subunit